MEILRTKALGNKALSLYEAWLAVAAESESLLEQIGCFGESIGFCNHFLEIAGLIAIGGVVQNLIKKK